LVLELKPLMAIGPKKDRKGLIAELRSVPQTVDVADTAEAPLGGRLRTMQWL
jgi:hypothetical protein